MSDRRSVATDALETLGTIIDDKQKRDAIHLAVIPATAGQILDPGVRVTLDNGVATRVVQTSDGIGIVDPFLERAVRKGEHFWLVIYPRTIQSLRHVWSHPAFPDEPVAGAQVVNQDETRVVGQIGQSKAESERWLRDFCDQSNHPSYERTMEAIGDGSEVDEFGLGVEGDASGEIPAEFWLHVEIVLGRKIENRPTYFSCWC